MKQEMICYLEKNKDDIKKLNDYLYNNPEESYNEYNSYNYICNFLIDHEFTVKKEFLDLKTSFYASKGNGYPKICFLCEYDAVPGDGHLTGHNLLTSTSIAAALTLSSVIEKIGGTIILIGCPGEYLGGTKSVMVKQGVFDDIDVVLVAHPDTITSESGSSSAIIPLSIKFIGHSGLSFLNKGSYTSLDGILLTFNILNSLLKGFPEDVEVNSILSNGGFTPLLLPLESEAKFYIRAKEMDIAKIAESKLREIAIYVSKLIRVQYSFSLYEPENEELITNRTLNRLFSHNLKENGIINISGPRDIYSGLSLGIVSKKVPCIHPYISIVTDDSIRYGTKEFANATISDYAFDEAMKAALSLSFTGYDIILNENLLSEVKNEFYKK
ncbi:M20 family peptidase [Clostridium tertium]|jgi:metal-dependent amidase/aminoacylase/carboxypeptidase family protein|uniref:Peptidase M20 domain-containing protein 2 n=1 Tax=Clostridium tertium TaxID=1559 RepID=A0A9X4B077_9CLOT|nr:MULTISPECIES: amidohydrolase [Clostridium]MBS5308618.1 M20 family peptidase [Clostridium sp.]MBS5886634.1 M20 family peptidase [Clostridium sp.]MBS6503162.1 M20 family peptidase [Clostridium sp.]MBU6133887.1 M20 family peptidase [Clostridium tertium]MDB1921267.1 M20 family peptidase [Clostridium tertium]